MSTYLIKLQRIHAQDSPRPKIPEACVANVGTVPRALAIPQGPFDHETLAAKIDGLKTSIHQLSGHKFITILLK